MFRPGDVLIQKYGGSSLASAERIRKVAERIAGQARSGKRLAVVVSAMGDTTDDLIALMHSISREPDPRELDQLMATGELVSCSLLVAALQKLGVNSRSFNAVNLGITTDGGFGNAEIRSFANLNALREFLKPGAVAIVAGFQGLTPAGDLTTLGRGGSDITAVAVARELGQLVCEKFTDEDGVYTADPRILPTARKVWHLDYDEMRTLALYGNGILHPRAIEYARQASIRIHVRSSFSFEEGTVVGPDGDDSLGIKSIAVDRKQAVVSIEGIQRPPLEIRLLRGISPFPITAREWRREEGKGHCLKIGFKLAQAFEALPVLWEEAVELRADDLLFNSRLAVLSMVGQGLETNPLLYRAILDRVAAAGFTTCLIEWQGIRLTLAVPEDQLRPMMTLLHTSIPGREGSDAR